ncbi:tetratricopeptide repeat protein [Phaeobacter marinintestinus]|uniref:tetratricopeptide repeat protein n=1 Tax=Falsiphaeobacter marinintestinus TaxID=1492905 RepID=UPI0011B6BEAE|nr:hypothetical protein [Phaeobacter marinintestinus]
MWHETDGALTPKSAKAQALLALLLSSDNLDRGRIWLQDKLWSDRAQQQGSASLRQALSDIRRSFGRHSDILKADRKTISLDPKRVNVLRRAADDDAEFLEGLDVRDPEFNIWLSAQRAQHMPMSQLTTGPVLASRRPVTGSVLFLSETPTTDACQITENLFIDGVAKTLNEDLEIEIFRRPPAITRPGMLMVSVQAFHAPNRSIGLRVSVEDIDTGRVIWSETNVSPSKGAPNTGDIAMLSLGNRLAGQLKTAVLDGRVTQGTDPDANALAALAIRKMFSMRHTDLLEAEIMLKQAYDIQRRGVFKSWLAQLYSIQFVERIRPIEDLRDRSEASCAHALELDPQNSNVLASVADASLVIGRNFARSAQLAKMSVAANPSNPRAWWTQASANLYFGDAQTAHVSAINAQTLATGTRLQFWTDIQRGLAAIVNGKTIEGIQLLESSSALAPDFHPPLRYLTALYSAAGMTEQAMDCARRLSVLEPDFTFERLSNDPDYPVSLMRQHGMLDTVELR